MGLTRRAHGASEKTATGYDLETLADDIIGFLDAVHAPPAILVGHSFAGVEMPRVAAKVPDRIVALVFLDTIYDWQLLLDPTSQSAGVNGVFGPPDSAMSSRDALERWYRRRFPDRWGPAWAATLPSQTYLERSGRVAWQLPNQLEGRFLDVAKRGADYSGIRAPTLAVWGNQTVPSVVSMTAFGYPDSVIDSARRWMAETDVKVKRAGVSSLLRAVPSANVVELQSPNTMQWFAPTEVIRLMNEFLSSLAR